MGWEGALLSATRFQFLGYLKRGAARAAWWAPFKDQLGAKRTRRPSPLQMHSGLGQTFDLFDMYMCYDSARPASFIHSFIHSRLSGPVFHSHTAAIHSYLL